MDIVEYINITPIELLGYARNNIIESQSKIKNLPYDYKIKLDKACDLLVDIQEYLYSH